MEILIVVLSWLLFGGATSYFASQRGRDPFAWFLIGMLLGILGLLLLFLLPPVNPEEADKQGEEQALAPVVPESSPYRLKEWFYLDQDRKQCGPFSFTMLKKGWQQGKVSSNTLVWSDGMEAWKPIEELPELREALQ
jgi:hypothetical protein